jgi:hypothetical protein
MKPANYLLIVIKGHQKPSIHGDQTPKDQESCLGLLDSHLHLPIFCIAQRPQKEACYRLHTSGITQGCVLGDVLSLKGQKV